MSTERTRADFESTGGLTVAAYRWDPTGDPGAVVQITHGMGEHALRYAHRAHALNEQGYVVYAQDHRGHGNTATSEAPGSWPSTRGLATSARSCRSTWP